MSQNNEKQAIAVESELLVARRYLEHGFIDAGMTILIRHAAHVAQDDWQLLIERLMERHRIADVVSICTLSGASLPRERLLAIGDRHLHRRDADGAIHFYEMGEADRERWSRVVDVLAMRPDRKLRAVSIAARYLVGDAAVSAASTVHAA